jgi:dipeptidyl aminopeptidase/acylaminoacyl peptidase
MGGKIMDDDPKPASGKSLPKSLLAVAAAVVAGVTVAAAVVVLLLPRGGSSEGSSACGYDLVIAEVDIGDGRPVIESLSGGTKHAVDAGEARELVPGWLARHPRISPDGRRLVVSRGIGGDYGTTGPDSEELWVMDVDGSDRMQLTAGGRADQPSWSPDGRSIMYLAADSENVEHLTTLAVDGSGTPHRLPVAHIFGANGASSPSWSPDGSRIAFGQAGDVVVMDAEGGNERTITTVGTPVSSLVWDPGGETLTVTEVGGDDRGWLMMRVNVATGHQTPLGPGFKARWSRDGERLYVLDPANDTNPIRVSSTIDGEAGPETAQDITLPLGLDPRALDTGISDFDIGPCPTVKPRR